MDIRETATAIIRTLHHSAMRVVREEHEQGLTHPKNKGYHKYQLNLITTGVYDYRYDFRLEEDDKFYRIVYNDTHNAGMKKTHVLIDKVTGELFRPMTNTTPRSIASLNLKDDTHRKYAIQNAAVTGEYL